MTNYYPIPTFILIQQSNNIENVKKEFTGRDEFAVNIIEHISDGQRMDNLKGTVRSIIQNASEINTEYIIVCKDNHQFSDGYSKEVLYRSIQCAKELKADILCGGLSIFKSVFRTSENVFWVEDFSGFPFTIIFRAFFGKILIGDHEILPFTNAKFFIYPFISTEFDVYEVTPINKETIEAEKSNAGFSNQVEIIEQVSAFYKDKVKFDEGNYNEDDFENVAIPTYIINLPERQDRLEHIKKQFAGKEEFDIKIIEACKNPIGALGLWESIRKIIKMAIDNDDDLLIICEDDHEFTANYSKSLLLKNIVEAHEQHTDMLSGGICWFDKALRITNNRAWVSTSYCTQFIILYKRVFEKILNEPYNYTVTADGMLSQILSNKMVFFPFISLQKDFGYSDISIKNNKDKEVERNLFDTQIERLKRIYEAKEAYIDVRLLK